MDKIVFICVNYNNASYTKEWVGSILNCDAYDSSLVEMIIVDNNSIESDKNSLKEIVNEHSQVKILYSEKNVGYFGGLNIGISNLAETIQYSHIVVGNNDITFDKSFIRNLKIEKHEENVFVIAPSIETDEGRLQNPHVIKRVHLIEKFKTKIYFSNYYIGQFIKILYQPFNSIIRKINKSKLNQPIEEKMVIKRGIGACYILTNKFIQRCGQLDDRIFLWGEEALLSHQIESNGGVTLYNPVFKVKHHESVTVSLIQKKKKYYMVRESYKIYKEYL